MYPHSNLCFVVCQRQYLQKPLTNWRFLSRAWKTCTLWRFFCSKFFYYLYYIIKKLLTDWPANIFLTGHHVAKLFPFLQVFTPNLCFWNGNVYGLSCDRQSIVHQEHYRHQVCIEDTSVHLAKFFSECFQYLHRTNHASDIIDWTAGNICWKFQIHKEHSSTCSGAPLLARYHFPSALSM